MSCGNSGARTVGADGDGRDKVDLCDLTPEGKPWVVHKREATTVSEIYEKNPDHERKAQRMRDCSGWLDFEQSVDQETGEVSYKFIHAHFCRVRYCPVCQWRKALMWRAKFYRVLPEILEKFPNARFIFLTLTVANCKIDDLRDTLQDMGKAWQRLIKRKLFQNVIGWVRSTEVKREDKGRKGYAHPHYHVLLMVPPSYFTHGYIKKSEWGKLWRDALRAEYEPVVDVRAVKDRRKKGKARDEVSAAVPEVLKYAVKAADMIGDADWFWGLTDQTHHLRFVAAGGVFKHVLRFTKREKVELVEQDPTGEFSGLLGAIMHFLWDAEGDGGKGGYYGWTHFLRDFKTWEDYWKFHRSPVGYR